jgi:hypothetical protein
LEALPDGGGAFQPGGEGGGESVGRYLAASSFEVAVSDEIWGDDRLLAQNEEERGLPFF